MRPTVKSDAYPFFEPNQILSADNLNQSFDYLDEQERLTRANLIGIGIVCGLNITYKTGANASIIVSKGVGVTSEGYLIVEPEDVTLVAYKKYQLPDDVAYPPFNKKSTDEKNPDKTYDLWELLTEKTTNSTALGEDPDFLKNKAVLLFLELRKEGLRNCTPSNCDDNGTAVSARIRRLLINREDLNAVIAAAKTLNSGLSSAEVAESIKARLKLKDIRQPRYDVPATRLIESSDVLMAFVTAIQELSKSTGEVLGASYKAFRPAIVDIFPADPFESFIKKAFGYKKILETEKQVLFLQYYYDFASDMIQAYDELRWKGLELLCACNPPEELFPRHLMLGLLVPQIVPCPEIYRQAFLPSPAVSPCGKLRGDVRLLLQRLVEMIKSFEVELLEDIRITPSSYGKVPLSEKAIPCYYSEQRTPQLYTFWDPVKSHRNRANENLGYRADEYKEVPPPFVTEPLNYNIEPYNFLRIEGHLGRDYRKVLIRMNELKKTNRLPFEFIALRTGSFEETVPLDLSKEQCEFQDLVALYKTLREELLSDLCEGLVLLYDVPFENAKTTAGSPQLPLLKEYAPGYTYHAGTVGAWYETILDNIAILDKFELSDDSIELRQKRLRQILDFFKMQGLAAELSAVGVLIYFITRFAGIIPDNIFSLSSTDINNRYRDLQDIVIFSSVLQQSGKSDALDKFTAGRYFTAKLKPVKTLYEEYLRRVREAKRKQFFSVFAKNNPGIQHGAGVPVGGTFVLVYHGTSDIGNAVKPAAAAAEKPAEISFVKEISPIFAEMSPMEVKMSKFAFTEKAGTPPAPPEAAAAPVYPAKTEMAAVPMAMVQGKTAGQAKFLDQADYTELRKFAADNPKLAGIIGKIAGFVANPKEPGVSKVTDVFDLIEPGIVIADFFLPYICCSDCTPVQYVLPRPAIDLSVEFGCTGPDGADVKLTSNSGVPSLVYRLDTQPFSDLQGTILVSPGSHTVMIRDSAGSESAEKSFTVPEMLAIGKEEYIENLKNQTYQVKFALSGGTIPYKAETSAIAAGATTRTKLADVRLSPTFSRTNLVTTGGSFADNVFTSDPIKYGQGMKVIVVDSVGCRVSKDFASPVRYILAVTVNPPGGGSVVRKPDSSTYSPGTHVILDAQANPGYLFSNWFEDAADRKNTVTITMDSDEKATANFKINSFTLTYTAGDGGTIKGTSPQTVEYGGSGTLVKAQPNEGYKFTKWSDGVTTAERTDSNVTSDGSFTANFVAEQTFTLTTVVSPLRSGTITLMPGGGTYSAGTVVTVIATPSSGRKFSYWVGPVANAELPQTTVTINSNTQVIANFTQAGSTGTVTTPPATTTVTEPTPPVPTRVATAPTVPTTGGTRTVPTRRVIG